MQYRFRFQPKSGSQTIMDHPAVAEVIPAWDDETGELDFDVVRLSLNGVDLQPKTIWHEAVHDYMASTFRSDLLKILAPVAEKATCLARAVG